MPSYPASFAEINRVCVDPNYRGLGVFQLLMVRAIIAAIDSGALNAIGAVESRSAPDRILEGLGFEPLGNQVTLCDPPRAAAKVEIRRLEIGACPEEFGERLLSLAQKKGWSIERRR